MTEWKAWTAEGVLLTNKFESLDDGAVSSAHGPEGTETMPSFSSHGGLSLSPLTYPRSTYKRILS